MEKRFEWIVVFSCILLLLGIFHTVKNIDNFYWITRIGIYNYFDRLTMRGIILMLFLWIAPLVRIAGSIKTLKKQEIGRKILIYASVTYFMIDLISTWNKTIYFLYNPNYPLVAEGTVAQIINLMPSHIVAVIDISTIFFFTRPDIKELFK